MAQPTVAIVLCSLFLLAATAVVEIKVGDNPQTLSNSNPEGTVFIIKQGLHRHFEVSNMKNHTVWIGEDGAVLSGAKVLSVWKKINNLWYAVNQTQTMQQHGDCVSSFYRCYYSNDLFMDSKPMIHVNSTSALTSGSNYWYFDYSNKQIITAENPTGHLMETSVTRRAFGGQFSQNITIKNLKVKMYAVPAQMGAIGDQKPGRYWRVENCEVFLNHGAGIRATTGSYIFNNKVYLNGQIGLRGDGNDTIWEANEIWGNNWAKFDYEWEGGATKFSNTHRVKLINNHAYNNTGHGLWTDISNYDSYYEGNLVEYHDGDGFKHEISYSVVMRNNVGRFNGRAFDLYGWGSNFLCQNSFDCTFDHNIAVTDHKGSGIGAMMTNRGNFYPVNLLARNNHIVHLPATRSFDSMNGLYGNINATTDAMFANGTWNNVFRSNRYHVPDTSRSYWILMGQRRSLAYLQALPFPLEVGSTVDANTQWRDELPTVNITSPANNDRVNSDFTVSAAASDDYFVHRVDFFVNNTLIGSSLKSPYQIRVTTSAWTQGNHQIKAVVYDVGRQTKEQSIVVTYGNIVVPESTPFDVEVFVTLVVNRTAASFTNSQLQAWLNQLVAALNIPRNMIDKVQVEVSPSSSLMTNVKFRLLSGYGIPPMTAMATLQSMVASNTLAGLDIVSVLSTEKVSGGSQPMLVGLVLFVGQLLLLL